MNINPDAEIVDICHKAASYDIFDAAFTLAQSYRFFPPDTIHLVGWPGCRHSAPAVAGADHGIQVRRPR